MSIPLVQNNEKDSINTSIIAIKRQIERINMLLGLVDSGGSDPDLSGFVKKSEVVDIVEAGNMNPVTSNAVVPVDEVTLGNMHSVSSNAVSKALSYSTEEQFTGKYWIDGKPIYSRSFSVAGIGTETWTNVINASWINNISRILDCVVSSDSISNYGGHPKTRIDNGYFQTWEVAGYTAGVMTLEYTKTTD